MLRRHLGLHPTVGAAGPERAHRCGGADRAAQPGLREDARARLRARRRPAEVRGRRPPAPVRQPGPRRAGRQRRRRAAGRAAGGRGRPHVGRPGGVAHVRRHPQRDGPPVPGRAEPPRAADRRPRRHGDDPDGARRRSGPDRRQRVHPGGLAGARRGRALRAWVRPPLAAAQGPVARPRPRSPRAAGGDRPLPPAGAAQPPARAVEGARAPCRDDRLPALRRRRRARWPARGRTPWPRRSTRSSPRCRTPPRPTTSPSSPPTSTRTAGKVVLATGLPSTGADDEGRMVRCVPPDRRSRPAAPDPDRASTAATSSSARSAWPTARRSRSWATR